MCGIAGIVRFDRPAAAQASRLRAMQARLEHRGPDGTGLHLGSFAALAHTRLALVDVAGSAQPMHSPDGRYTLVYNGEVYNYPELREQLRHAWAFRTAGDTEVVLAAWATWGAECLPRLDGMFAFFVWDEQQQCGFAARDRLGIKPFVYRHHDGELLFASEAKALLAAVGTSPRADRDAVLEYLVAPCFSGVTHAMFAGIDHLQAGQLLHIDRSGLRLRCWWDYDNTDPPDDSTEHLAGAVLARLNDAVRLSLRADFPVAVFLSGGVDSTLLAALACRHLPAPPEAFTIRFAGQEAFDYSRPGIVLQDDAPFALAAARQLSLPCEVVVPDRGLLSRELEQVAIIDDALPAWEQELTQHHLARAASRTHKAVLVGDAADETHYGYHFLLDEQSTRSPSAILRRFGPVPISRDLLADPLAHFDDKYRQLALNAGHCWDGPRQRLLATTYLIVKRWLARLLHNGDIHAMHWSLEARVPFGAIDLVDLARRVPPEVGMAAGVEKALLREAGRGIIPENIRRRKKSALPSDQAAGPHYQRETALLQRGEMRPFLAAFLDLAQIEELCASGRHLSDSERALLFRVIALGHWARHYEVRPPS
jgi:asparagine synthase (glutamine-hydrolysing)